MSNKINVHNNWDPLEEIWLGDTWPKSFYDDITNAEVRDSFHQVTEWSKEDLNAIQKKFEELGVIVRRPTIDESKRELYTVNEKSSILKKPPICPRDTHAVIGNNLFVGGDLPECYEPIYTHYDPSQVHKHQKDPTVPNLNGADTVKLGRDIIFDHGVDENWGYDIETRKNSIFERVYSFEQKEKKWFGDDYRLHFGTDGGHLDSCYMPIKEGVVLTTKHIDGYEELMPGWKTIGIRHPSYMSEKASYKTSNVMRSTKSDNPMMVNKWQGNFSGMMDDAPAHFNSYIQQYCKDWVGDYKETYFEVNVVPLDDKNLMCINTSSIFDGLFERLEKEGVTCHVVPWRTRGFWDGGIHCITLDVRRRGELTDYFPERKDYGISTVKSQLFYDTESFFKEYAEWKSQR
jgi:hypothetical protein|tara:strand:- start:228 stop:1436 length:1209 start_codon:yes stop_codon:yes gene_type:complete